MGTETFTLMSFQLKSRPFRTKKIDISSITFCYSTNTTKNKICKATIVILYPHFSRPDVVAVLCYKPYEATLRQSTDFLIDIQSVKNNQVQSLAVFAFLLGCPP